MSADLTDLRIGREADDMLADAVECGELTWEEGQRAIDKANALARRDGYGMINATTMRHAMGWVEANRTDERN